MKIFLLVVVNAIWGLGALAVSFSVVPLWDYAAYQNGYRLTQSLVTLADFASLSLGVVLAVPPALTIILPRCRLPVMASGALGVLCLVLLIAPFYCGAVFRSPPVEVFVSGLADRFADDLDGEAIYDWGMTQIEAGTDNADLRKSLPVSLRTLSPHQHYVESDLLRPAGWEDAHLAVRWGGGFGFWGLVVVDKDKVPPSLPDGIVLREWEPGLYAFVFPL